MDHVAIESTTTVAAKMEAAGIWARATDERDSRTESSDPAAKLEGIQARLDCPGATLHVAYRKGAAEGFALLVPHGSELELVYLAVDPAAWGRQTASALLAHVSFYAAQCRYEAVVLWVLADNPRAIRTYTRAGWRRTEKTKRESDRHELQMVLSLASRGPNSS